jgi:hypothetical protein
MLRPSFLRRALAVGIVLAGSLGLSRGQAQTTVGTPTAQRDNQSETADGDILAKNQINLKDCENGDFFTFTLDRNALAGLPYNTEVWMSEQKDTVCTDEATRNDTCRQVAPGVISIYVIDVYVRDIVSDVKGSWNGGGAMADPAVCIKADETLNRRFLHFIAVNLETPTEVALYELEYDLLGPGPPGSVQAGIGESALVATWKEASNATEVAEYQVYAEPVSAPAPAGGAGGGAGASTAGAGMAGAGMAGASAAGAGAAGDTGAAGAAGAGAGTGGASGEVTGCTSMLLTPGEPVPAGVDPRGTASNSSTKAEAKGLTNGVRYALGVASVDKFNNPGNLSKLDCATPEPVTGFYEAYRAAGGQAGGGYCAFGASPSRFLAGGVALAALGLVLRRIRARSKQGNERGTS